MTKRFLQLTLLAAVPVFAACDEIEIDDGLSNIGTSGQDGPCDRHEDPAVNAMKAGHGDSCEPTSGGGESGDDACKNGLSCQDGTCQYCECKIQEKGWQKVAFMEAVDDPNDSCRPPVHTSQQFKVVCKDEDGDWIDVGDSCDRLNHGTTPGAGAIAACSNFVDCSDGVREESVAAGFLPSLCSETQCGCEGYNEFMGKSDMKEVLGEYILEQVPQWLGGPAGDPCTQFAGEVLAAAVDAGAACDPLQEWLEGLPGTLRNPPTGAELTACLGAVSQCQLQTITRRLEECTAPVEAGDSCTDSEDCDEHWDCVNGQCRQRGFHVCNNDAAFASAACGAWSCTAPSKPQICRPPDWWAGNYAVCPR
jgi:hypothetical protein